MKESRKGEVDKRLPAARRREVILDAALRAFMESGYDGAHMDAIAERAGVTKPILYRHFRSKLELLLAIIDREGRELIRSISRPRDETIDWRTSIALDVKAYLDFVEGRRAGFIMLYSQGIDISREVAAHMAAVRGEVGGIIAEHVRFYADTEAVPPTEIDLVAAMLGTMVETAAMYWVSNAGVAREFCEKNLVRYITRIMAGFPPRKR